MKKNLFKIALVAMLGVFATANSSKAQAFEEGVSVAQIGYGFPNLGKSLLTSTDETDYKAFGFGPLHARFEYGITDTWGIGVSINMVSFGARWTQQEAVYDEFGYPTGAYTTYDHEDKVMSWNVLVRFNRHWDVNDNVDIYGGFGLGYNKWTWTHETNDPDYIDDSFTFPIPVGYEATVGMRYYFTDNIGAYIEAGWSKSILQAGIAMKF